MVLRLFRRNREIGGRRMSQLEQIDKLEKFKIVGRNGEIEIKEFSSQYEADLYCECLNRERLERLGLIEHLNIPAIEFE